MIKIIYVFILIASYSCANVFGGSNLGHWGYSKHTCLKPMKLYKPYSFNSQWELDKYNMDVDNYNNQWRYYVSCIEEYLENANNDIKRIQEKQQEAIAEAESKY